MITADVVKKLRDMTGAGMMDCKRALTEANGDMDKAVDVLRKSGAAKAEKKSGRATKEGKVACYVDGNVAAMVEVLCETDFVAKTDKFNAYIDELLKRIAAGEGNGCVSEAVQAAEKEAMVALIATIGENMQIRRAARWAADGKLASYIHMQGRIGVLVEVEGRKRFRQFGKIVRFARRREILMVVGNRNEIVPRRSIRTTHFKRSSFPVRTVGMQMRIPLESGNPNQIVSDRINTSI